MWMNPSLYIYPNIKIDRMSTIISPLIISCNWARRLNQAPIMYTIKLVRNQNGSRFIYSLFRSSLY